MVIGSFSMVQFFDHGLHINPLTTSLCEVLNNLFSEKNSFISRILIRKGECVSLRMLLTMKPSINLLGGIIIFHKNKFSNYIQIFIFVTQNLRKQEHIHFTIHHLIIRFKHKIFIWKSFNISLLSNSYNNIFSPFQR